MKYTLLLTTCLLSSLLFSQTQAWINVSNNGTPFSGHFDLLQGAQEIIVNGQKVIQLSSPTTYNFNSKGFQTVSTTGTVQVILDTAVVPLWSVFNPQIMIAGQPCPGNLPGAGEGVLAVDGSSNRLWFCAGTVWAYILFASQ